ncbi:hypothetical protein F2P81_005238 [Scophthalmus maximus]|uniref:Uncharacterized protein n=1 Tax=Scophthalmus maximus TaxID=52904 RepID=A0A6A4T2K6_SCOMX|nr:hypothetical protein F2P81_005238 [Scophthalmus maximus]
MAAAAAAAAAPEEEEEVVEDRRPIRRVRSKSDTPYITEARISLHLETGTRCHPVPVLSSASVTRTATAIAIAIAIAFTFTFTSARSPRIACSSSLDLDGKSSFHRSNGR